MPDPWYARLLGCPTFEPPWLSSEAGQKVPGIAVLSRSATSPATSLLATVTADQSALSSEYPFFTACIVFGWIFTGKLTGFYFFLHLQPKTQITSLHEIKIGDKKRSRYTYL